MALTVVVTLVLVFTRLGRNLYSVGQAAGRRGTLWTAAEEDDRRRLHRERAFRGAARRRALARLRPAYIRDGGFLLLPSIAVVVIGGTSIFGGKADR